MKNIIELNYDDDLFVCMDSFLDFHVKFLGNRLLNIKISDVIETIKDLNKDYEGKELTDDDIFINYAKGNEEQFYKEFMEEFQPYKNYKNLKEILKGGWIYELLEYFIDLYDGDNNLKDLCEVNNCKFGTVGYSDWSYYITHKNIEHEFANDLWEGRNWYSVSLIQDNDVVDSIGSCYITDKKYLDDIVEGHFGIDKDDFYVVNNEIGEWFDKPKVEKIEHVEYSFEIID